MKFLKLEKQARGKLIGNIINLDDDEKVSTIIKVREFEKNKNFILRNTKWSR